MMRFDRSDRAYRLSNIDSLQLWRHFVQLVTFTFLNAKAFGLISTAIIVPFLHTTQSPFSSAIGAYDALEYSISHASFPILVLGVIYLSSITVGRVFCGWACPIGMIQDFLSYFPIRKRHLARSTTDSLNDVKWAILAFSLLTTILVGYRRIIYPYTYPVGVFSDCPFAVISPGTTLFGYLPWTLFWSRATVLLGRMGLIVWTKLAMLFALLLVPCLFVPRFFCRFVCPLATMLQMASPYKMLRIVRTAAFSKEDFNRMLADVCPMEVQVKTDADIIEHEDCIHCGKCLIESARMVEQRWQ